MGDKITMEHTEEFTVLPENSIVIVECVDTAVKTVGEGDRAWTKLECKFEIIEAPKGYADQVGRPIWGSVPFRLTDHADNKLRQWIEALLGIEPSEGFEFDTDMFLRRRAKGIIGHYTGRSGVRHQVSALIPGSTLSPQQAAAPQAQAQRAQQDQQVQQPTLVGAVQGAVAPQARPAPASVPTDEVPF